MGRRLCSDTRGGLFRRRGLFSSRRWRRLPSKRVQRQPIAAHREEQRESRRREPVGRGVRAWNNVLVGLIGGIASMIHEFERRGDLRKGSKRVASYWPLVDTVGMRFWPAIVASTALLLGASAGAADSTATIEF